MVENGGKMATKTKKGLQKLYVEELKDLYSAETQLTKALPKMAKGATSPQLRQAFETHLRETEGHVQRLQQIFEGLEAGARGKKCKGMEGLIEEGEELLKEKSDFEPDALDAGLIGAAQRVEHYEIAAYGTARTFAQQLGEEEAARLLQQTLDEEYATDEKLTALAVGGINQEAEMA
jgi:ferritin-like metal-binding protein YciE